MHFWNQQDFETFYIHIVDSLVACTAASYLPGELKPSSTGHLPWNKEADVYL